MLTIQPINYARRYPTAIQKNNNLQKIAFKGGLPYSFIKHVEQLDVSSVEKILSEKGIMTDFKGSKVVAACSEKVVDIFEKYKLALPQKIEFTPLEKEVLGCCCCEDGLIKINSDIEAFHNIRRLSELEESQGNFHPTEHFLATFIHEFVHNAHFQNVSNKVKPYELSEHFWAELSEMQIRPFWTKLQGNGEYSATNTVEYMAELMTRKIVGNLDDNLRFRYIPKLDIFEDYTTQLELPAPYSGVPSWAFEHENRNYVGNKSIMGLARATNKAIWDGDVKFLRHYGLGMNGQISFSDMQAIGKTVNGIFNTLFG